MEILFHPDGMGHVLFSKGPLTIQLWSRRDIYTWPPRFHKSPVTYQWANWILEAPCITIGWNMRRAVWRS